LLQRSAKGYIKVRRLCPIKTEIVDIPGKNKLARWHLFCKRI